MIWMKKLQCSNEENNGVTDVKKLTEHLMKEK